MLGQSEDADVAPLRHNGVTTGVVRELNIGQRHGVRFWVDEEFSRLVGSVGIVDHNGMSTIDEVEGDSAIVYRTR